MSNEDEEINCLNCDFCNKLLVEPISLPCGNTICNIHIKELLNSENVIECILCYENHPVPENALKRIKLEISEFNFNQVVSECKQKIDEARQKAESIVSLAIDPEFFINERFDLVKTHINWRRKDLKNEIDKYTDELIESVEKNRSSCIELSRENYQMKERIDSSRLEFEELKKNLDTCETDRSVEDVKFVKIAKDAEDLEKRLGQLLAEYKNSLLLNKDYLFVFFDHPLEDVLGKVIDKNTIEPAEESEKEPQQQTQQEPLEGALEGPESEIESLATSQPQLEEADEEPLQEPSQGTPKKSQILQQPSLKFRFKKSNNPKHLNSFPQLAYQGNIYNFVVKRKNPKSLIYRCKNSKVLIDGQYYFCSALFHVSFDQKVIKETAHRCNGSIVNATIIEEQFTELKENQLQEFNFDR